MHTNLEKLQSAAQTMTSREIAKLTGKNHAHVLRDIDNILKSLDNPELGSGFKSSTYISGDPPREYRQYDMDRDSTYCLMAGYDVSARMKIIKRWQELESKLPTLPDFTNPAEAARAWAEQYDRAEQQKKAFEAARPMIDFHEEVAQAEGEFTVSQVCKVLFNGVVKEKDFRQWLKTNSWMDKRKGMNQPTAWAIGRKYMRLRMSPPINGKVYEVPVITGMGLTTLRHLYRTNELFVATIPREKRPVISQSSLRC